MFKAFEISPYCWNVVHFIIILLSIFAFFGFVVKRICSYFTFLNIFTVWKSSKKEAILKLIQTILLYVFTWKAFLSVYLMSLTCLTLFTWANIYYSTLISLKGLLNFILAISFKII